VAGELVVVLLIYGRSLPFIHLEEMTSLRIPHQLGTHPTINQ
jgi:hypothetical protein